MTSRDPAFDHRARWWVVSVGLAWISGCSGAGFFECSSAEQCALDGQSGTCEADGYCSFPDEACDSGRRYGELAPPGVAGTCVPAASGTTGPMMPGGGSTRAETVSGDGGGTSSSGAPPLDEGSTSRGPPAEGSSSGVMPPVSTSAAESSEGGPSTVMLSYPAAVTGCNDPVNLDPMLCEVQANPTPGAMTVDQEDLMVGPWVSFLRFDLDGAVDPEAVVSVTLRMVATSDRNADSTASGEVYEVEPFDGDDLTMLQPAALGMALALDQGAVLPDDVVEWSLPPAVLDGGEPSLYLGVFPTATDGVDYWSNDGVVPPELIIEQRT